MPEARVPVKVGRNARLGGYAGGIPSQGYTAEIESNGTVNLWRVDNFTLLGSYSISGFSLGTWYTLALRANGNQLSVEVNGSTVIGPVTDSAFTITTTANPTGTLYFLHSDHLGSTSAVTNFSGSVIARQWYYPYGAVRGSVGTLPTKRTYTGQIADDTGLMFYNARYYSPLMGRFASADPLPPVPGGCPPTGGTGGCRSRATRRR